MNLSWLISEVKGIPVLMYHRVWPGGCDDLTISPERLREQWQFLATEGYSTLSLSAFLDIAEGKAPAPEKAVLITFDDGCRNNLQYAYPLLHEMNFKATFFIIGNTLDGTAAKETGIEEKMTVDELRSLDPSTVQLAMHGYAHESFSKITVEEISRALSNATRAFDYSGLPYTKVWAYAYGARPSHMAGLKRLLNRAGITAAFRIGNQPNKMPAQDIYQIKRIDIKGADTLEEFKIKLKKGKLKPF